MSRMKIRNKNYFIMSYAFLSKIFHLSTPTSGHLIHCSFFQFFFLKFFNLKKSIKTWVEILYTIKYKRLKLKFNYLSKEQLKIKQKLEKVENNVQFIMHSSSTVLHTRSPLHACVRPTYQLFGRHQNGHFFLHADSFSLIT